MRILSSLVTILTSLAISFPSYAAPCGDDVDGRRVACRCGDTVISDTTLLPSDPVVTERCTLDGLVVRAAARSESIRLDLAGLSIQGSGVGAGIDVAYGGADGASIVGGPAGNRGSIAGFGVGLFNTWREALARVDRLEIYDNSAEGIRSVIAGTLFEDIEVRGNGRDGIHLKGTGGRLVAVRSRANGENGIRLFASNVAVDAVAEDNARSGIIADGDDNDLSSAEAGGNGRDGIVVRGLSKNSKVARSEANLGDDLRWNGQRLNDGVSR